MTYLRILALTASVMLVSCASNKPFTPKSDYPPDPWVKGYANPNDCIGGEKLAARAFDLPEYPRKAFKRGQQGWVILRLDVDAGGATTNVAVQRSLPSGPFGDAAVKAAKAWQFEPPAGGPLDNCRVLIRFRLGAVSLGG